MEWYYAGKDDEQIGPVSEEQVKELIKKGDITAATPVWNEGMEDWLPTKATPLASDLPKTAPPPLNRSAAERPATGAASFERDDKLVYPPNPPRSPHMAWLNVLGIGLAQIVFGKTGLGITCVAGSTVLSTLASVVNIANGGESGFSGFLYIIVLLLLVASMVDAYMTGNRLREGQVIGKWQIFPLRNPNT